MKRQHDYMRWAVKGAFVMAMLFLVSIFVEEYKVSEYKVRQASEVSKTIQIPAPPPSQSAPADLPPKGSSPEPRGGSALPPTTAPAPTIAQPTKIEVEILGAKFSMSNEASWAAIAKIIVTILATFFGLRLINFIFKRLEGPQPAT